MSGGVTFRFGTKGRKPKASPLAMQQTIMDQNAKIEHQDEMLKIQANKIDSLEKELLDLKRLITQKVSVRKAAKHRFAAFFLITRLQKTCVR